MSNLLTGGASAGQRLCGLDHGVETFAAFGGASRPVFDPVLRGASVQDPDAPRVAIAGLSQPSLCSRQAPGASQVSFDDAGLASLPQLQGSDVCSGPVPPGWGAYAFDLSCSV